MGAVLSACPPARILEWLLAEQLVGAERDSVETHVELCTVCQQRLEGLVAPTVRTATSAEVRPLDPGAQPAEGFLSRLRELAPPRADGSLGAPPPPAAGFDAVSGDTAKLTDGRLGPYEILGKLGKGGMGDVFKARHTALGKVVALKVLPVERMDEVTIARFKNEVQAIGKLNHPNIVVAYDAGESRGVHFLVMELVDGTDLDRLVGRLGRLSVPDACDVIRQAAAGLQHAYEQGLVHRDIKPSNLMLSRDGRVRLLDLGLARSFGETTADALTAQGTLLGTADYLAPEQWDHPHGADTRADIYSLGCTLYHLLAGHAPFGGGRYSTVLGKMRAHLEVPPPPIGQYCPDAPAGLVAALERMLAKAPADRFAAPAEVAAALQPFTAGASLARLLDGGSGAAVPPGIASAAAATPTPGVRETDPVPSERWRPSSARRRAPPAVVAVLGLLMVAGLLVLWAGGLLGPAAAPLAIQDLRVRHFDGKDERFLGDLRTSPSPVRLNDKVEIAAELSAPAYYYLIAFNPKGSDDGLQQLCQPEDKDGKGADAVRPDRRDDVRYPSKHYFALDATGLQAFVLAASTRPLPPYKEWRSRAGTVPWQGVKDGGSWRWHFNGRTFSRFPEERGKLEAKVPPPLDDLRKFFADRPEFQDVQIVAFPVVDNPK